MKLDEFLSEFENLRLGLMQLEKPDELRRGFDESQLKLGELLAHMQDFSEDEQLVARVKVQEFAAELEAKIKNLRDKLKDIELDSDLQKKRIRSLKAYNQGKIF